MNKIPMKAMDLEDWIKSLPNDDRIVVSIDKFGSAMLGSKKKNEYYMVPGQSTLKPEYYKGQTIEVIDTIEDWDLNHHRASALQYVVRAGRKSKDTEIEDLEKAIWWLKREVKRLTKPDGEQLGFDFKNIQLEDEPKFPQDYLKKDEGNSVS